LRLSTLANFVRFMAISSGLTYSSAGCGGLLGRRSCWKSPYVGAGHGPRTRQHGRQRHDSVRLVPCNDHLMVRAPAARVSRRCLAARNLSVLAAR
jgi:hypothetical protein